MTVVIVTMIMMIAVFIFGVIFIVFVLVVLFFSMVIVVTFLVVRVIVIMIIVLVFGVLVVVSMLVMGMFIIMIFMFIFVIIMRVLIVVLVMMAVPATKDGGFTESQNLGARRVQQFQRHCIASKVFNGVFEPRSQVFANPNHEIRFLKRTGFGRTQRIAMGRRALLHQKLWGAKVTHDLRDKRMHRGNVCRDGWDIRVGGCGGQH
jgi:hypothetical protein